MLIRLVQVAAVSAALAACGSTVPVAGDGSRGGHWESVGGVPPSLDGSLGSPDGSFESPDGFLGANNSSGANVTPGSTSPDLDGGGDAANSADRGPTSSNSAAQAPAAAESQAPVEVGFFVNENAEAVYKALGLNGTLGDGEPMARAVVSHVNAHGGLLGRRISPVFAFLDGASATPFEGQAEAACSRFTHDHHVLAVVNGSGTQPVMLSCLNRARVPFFAPVGGNDFPATTYLANPLLVSPGGLNHDRMSRPYVNTLADSGYFRQAEATAPVKIGLLHYDTPQDRQVAERSLEPALRARGLSLTASFAGTSPRNMDDLATLNAQMSNAVLRFRSEGISHVLFLDSGGGLALFFMSNAESQKYNPRYGLTSDVWPTAGLLGTVPTAQLRHSMGIGWRPSIDVDAAHDPGAGELERRCTTIMRDAGVDVSSRGTLSTALSICDSVFLLQSAIDRGGDVSTAGVLAGLERTGIAFVPGGTFAGRFSRDRRDGVNAIRAFIFDDACTCFRYTSENRAVGD